MLTVKVGGGEYNLATYSLSALKRAAPFMDRARALDDENSPTRMQDLMDQAEAILGVVWAGLVSDHPDLTLDRLMDTTDWPSLVALREQYDQVQEVLGLVRPQVATMPTDSSAS